MSTNNGPVYDAATVRSILGIPYGAERLQAFGSPPATVPGFLTFFDPGFSIMTLRSSPIIKPGMFCTQDWYHREPFALRDDQPCHRQLHMEAIPASFNKTFAQQQAMLPTEEEVPSARVVVAAMIIHFLASGFKLFPHYWVRCPDEDSDGGRVCVGDFDRGGLDVRGYWDDDRDSGIGLASSRKF